MEHRQSTFADPNRTLLLATARVMVLRGNQEFSIAELCNEAGVARSVFHDHFAGRTALMAALMREYSAAGSEPAPQVIAAVPSPSVSKADDVTPGPSVNTPDEWFERRLRVFERALTTLEAKAETTAREQARIISELQDQLKGVHPPELGHVEALPALGSATTTEIAQVHSLEPVAEAPAMVQESTQAEMPVLDEVALTAIPSVEEAAGIGAQTRPDETKTEPMATVDAIGDALPGTRNLPDIEVLPAPKRQGASTRMRVMSIAAALLVGAFIGVGYMLGHNMLDANAQERAPDGVAHRQEAHTALQKTMALADAGDARAQARLALAYLRGQGSAADANAALLWCLSAARSGNPVAQYLLGALYQQGDHVAADPAQAVNWFARAAEKGNLKAMHNLAIAYAQGQGTPKDEAKAAEWFTRAAERGYVDSAFDLAVLYERGEGVQQDLRQALKWYGIAAFAGDQPSKQRAEFLRSQMKPADIKLATGAAMAFAPLPPLADANSL